MYLIEVKETETNKPVIAFSGRIENYDAIKSELLQIIGLIQNADTVIIDLGGIESISDECFSIFSELADSWQLRFIKYSLFIEDKLRAMKLLENSLPITLENEPSKERT